MWDQSHKTCIAFCTFCAFKIFEAILGNSFGHDSLWASMANRWFVVPRLHMLEICKKIPIASIAYIVQFEGLKGIPWTAHDVRVLSWSCASAGLTSASRDPWKRWPWPYLYRSRSSRSRPAKKSMWLRGTRDFWWHGLQHTRVAGCPQSRKHGWCPSSACNDMMHQYADAFFARSCWSWILFTERCNQCIFKSYLILCF